MSGAKPKYYLVEATALPEVFVKVTEAKALLETGEARTVAEAVVLQVQGLHCSFPRHEARRNNDFPHKAAR